MIIQEDLYDIYGILIAKKGRKITQYLIDKIKSIPKKNHIKRLMKNTFIYEDVKEALLEKKYETIFGNKADRKKILKIAANTVFEDGLIKELAYMKKNNPYTYRHELVVGILTIKMTLSLKQYRLNSRSVSYGAFTHDIGKNRIPNTTLEKKKPFTVYEYELMRTHPAIGYLLLVRYERKKDSRSAITAYEHHEKLDGSGYPTGRRKINIYAQLVAVNDILDALLAERPYRKEPFILRAALDYLLDEAKQGRLNKDAVYALISYARKTKPDIKTMKVSQAKRGTPPKKNSYGKILQSMIHW